MCLIYMYNFWYVNMQNMTTGYGFNAFSVNFHILLLHIGNVLTSSNFYKLCVEAEVFR